MLGGRHACVALKPFAAILLLTAWPLAAPAAWLGYKNETATPIIVQTSVLVNGRVMRGKAHLLYPGEIAWDNIAAPGARSVSIYDPKANNRLVFQDTVNVANQDVFVAARLVQPPLLPGMKAPLPPQVRLVGTVAPVPGGVVPTRPTTPAPATPNIPRPTIPVRPPTPTPTKPSPPVNPPRPTVPPAGTIPVRPPTNPPPASGKTGN